MTINENMVGSQRDDLPSQLPTTPFDNTFNTEHIEAGTLELEVSKVTNEDLDLTRQ